MTETLEQLEKRLGLTWHGVGLVCGQDLQYFSKKSNTWQNTPYRLVALEIEDYLKHDYLIRLNPKQGL